MVLWLALHALIGAAGTWLARRYALQRELIDHPDARRSHAIPTPRGGGIAIVIALLVAASVLGARQPQHIVLLAAFVTGLMLVAGVGLVDDHRPLSPWLRLVIQMVASAILALGVAATWANLPLALIAFAASMVLTNVWNFMDGIDGIAASQAALVAAGMGFVVGGTWGWLAMALVAACVGFMPFNFPRAKIFLGDVGSGALGFVLAMLFTIALAQRAEAWPLLLMPLSVFLVDSGLTLLRRLLRRERWWTPHAQHAYQCWARRIGAHATVTLAYAGWTSLAWLLAWQMEGKPMGQAVALCLGWILVLAGLWGLVQYSCASGRGAQTRDGKRTRDEFLD